MTRDDVLQAARRYLIEHPGKRTLVEIRSNLGITLPPGPNGSAMLANALSLGYRQDLLIKMTIDGKNYYEVPVGFRGWGFAYDSRVSAD